MRPRVFPVRRKRNGRPSQTWAPIIDGTLRGPEAVFALLLSYARQIGLNAADKVLFIADGAPWIWRRLPRLIAALGLSPTQVLGLTLHPIELRPVASMRPRVFPAEDHRAPW